MEERWKEAAETFELALRMMETPQGGPSALPASVFATLAFALRSYSSQVVRMHKEDQVAMQFMDRVQSDKTSKDFGFCKSSPLHFCLLTHGCCRLFTSAAADQGRTALLAGLHGASDHGEGRHRACKCLPPPLVDSLIDSIALQELFYTELLKGLVLEGLAPFARRLLEMRSFNTVSSLHVLSPISPSSAQIKVKAEDENKLAEVEGLATRALKKMGGLTAKENAIVLEHLVEGRELRQRDIDIATFNEEFYYDEESDELDDLDS